MPEVFISHSVLNRSTALDVKAGLADLNVSSWMAPDDIPTGENWEVAIVDAISNALVFVLLLSDQSQGSLQVRRELSVAASNQKVIIPLRLDGVSLQGTFAYYLTNTQWQELDSTTIKQCCFFIHKQIATLSDTKSKTLLALTDKTKRPERISEKFIPRDLGPNALDLDVTHSLYISTQQSRRGHTRILKIGIGIEAESLEVKIPAGIKSGTRLRIKGKGNQCQNSGVRGDLYLLIKIAEM